MSHDADCNLDGDPSMGVMAFDGCVPHCPAQITLHTDNLRRIIPEVGERAQVMAAAILNVSARLRRLEEKETP